MMNTWITEKAAVFEVSYDYDLHSLAVYDLTGEKIGEIYPNTIEEMNAMIDQLDNGACPVEEGWEDGLGNVIGR